MSRHYQRGTPYERLVAKVMVDERGCWPRPPGRCGMSGTEIVETPRSLTLVARPGEVYQP